MAQRTKKAGHDEIISVQNERDGHVYRASIIWDRKAISVEETSAAAGQKEIVRYDIFAEAWAWRGGWFDLTFRPSLVISYRPAEPQDARPANFRELLGAIIAECDLAEVAAGGVEGRLQGLCAPYRIWPLFGHRRHSLTFRRVPHVLLFGWPEGRPFPIG